MAKKGSAKAGAPAGSGTATGRPVAVPGPLAPWRLSIVVGIAAMTTGEPLIAAAETGSGLDMALLRSFGIAFLAWVALGKINRTLAQAEADRLAHPSATLSVVADLADDAASPSGGADAAAPADRAA